MAPSKFDWTKLETKWQKKWAWANIYQTDPKSGKPKYFLTAAYPYPNSPQHIGHARTYTLADANARFHRMRGYNVLFPMGFHYTGAPIFAMAKRLSQNDPEIIRTFTEIYGIPEKKLDSLKQPLKMAEYFRDDIKKGMIEMGFSIDWRREFTTADPLYTRFIEWHFRWLREKGLITRGTHPVAWCPNDQNPVGTVDTQGDIEPEIGEQYLVKFEQSGIFYPTATLRPETVFGVTNLWVKSDTEYVQALVDNEKWVLAEAGVEKLVHQNHRVEVEKRFPGKDLVWTTVVNPVTKKQVPILSASFVEPDEGTGIVMSVPAHAPYDYQALVELKTRAASSQDSESRVASIEPISIIETEGFSEYPAKDLVEKNAISGQEDPRLLEATKDLYSKELRVGKMKVNVPGYAGMPVEQARKTIVQELQEKGQISILYELTNGPITCRCGTRCLVHIVENQWFINYGDANWKALAHQAMDKTTILPEERRPEFNYTIDWLRERACARKVGLGTRLPWDKDWTIEALSDSVIYMAYYILAKYISKEWMTFKKFQKNTDKLPDSFFNYLFLGEGLPEKVATETGFPKRVLSAIRKEFSHFYPVDMRHSAKDLVTNHLTFFIFHHSVLFPQELWPKGIAANGFVLMDRQKMSKSLENIIPLRHAHAKYGADPLRIAVLATAELNQDTDFSDSLAASIQERLVNLVAQSRKIGRRQAGKKTKYSTLDRWMLTRLHKAIATVTSSMERLRLREAINVVLYQLDNDVAWYQRRLGPSSRRGDNRDAVLRIIFETKARLLSPVAPHVAEEVWSNVRGNSLVAVANWPQVDQLIIDGEAELAESIVMQIMDDTQEILKATGITPKKIIYYSAAPWKWQIYNKALAFASDKSEAPGSFIKDMMAEQEFRRLGKVAVDFVNRSLQQAKQMDTDMRKERQLAKKVDEKSALEAAKDFYKREFKADVQIWREDDSGVYDPKGKARFAEPYRPAIYVE
jgi:leucyl-tRNA synthetase